MNTISKGLAFHSAIKMAKLRPQLDERTIYDESNFDTCPAFGACRLLK
jgi:hypothetical protein